jgi:oxygen-independent coproporphyrinogen-3 oxidase
MDLSLYLHIPFCARKCRYCDFYSLPYDRDVADMFIDALAREWRMRCDAGTVSADARIATIYIGGGTPGVLTPGQWESLGRILASMPMAPDIEFTVECNPESWSPGAARLWASLNVNRLSLGVQSLDDRELSVLGRGHTAAQALAVIDEAAAFGFSIAADCIVGIPGQTAASLEQTLRRLSGHPGIDHLSAYELTIHENTPFSRHRRLLPLPSDESMARLMTVTNAVCARNGFEQYEISNYARPGKRCRHNLAYWDHRPYIGLGPAAHSFLLPHRWSNIADVNRYIAGMRDGRPIHEVEETLDAAMLAHEMIFLRLRTAEGLDERRFAELTGTEFATGGRNRVLDRLVKDGFLSHDPPFFRPTEKGMLVADGMARKLV